MVNSKGIHDETKHWLLKHSRLARLFMQTRIAPTKHHTLERSETCFGVYDGDLVSFLNRKSI